VKVSFIQIQRKLRKHETIKKDMLRTYFYLVVQSTPHLEAWCWPRDCQVGWLVVSAESARPKKIIKGHLLQKQKQKTN